MAQIFELQKDDEIILVSVESKEPINKRSCVHDVLDLLKAKGFEVKPAGSGEVIITKTISFENGNLNLWDREAISYERH